MVLGMPLCSGPLSATELLYLPDVVWPQFYTVVHWIQAATAALSVIGSSSVIGYALFQNTARSPEVRPLFYLSLSNLFLGVLWLIGALLYRKEATQPLIQTCYNLQLTAQIFYVASFLYTINYTWHLYMDLKGKCHQHLHSQSPQVLNPVGRIAIILSIVIPLLLMIPVLVVGNYYKCYQNNTGTNGCLLIQMEISCPKQPSCCRISYYSITIFLLSFVLSFLTILVLLIRARVLYKRFIISTGFVGDRQWAMIKMVERGVVLYPVVFFYCWGPAFLHGLTELIHVNNQTFFMVLCISEALTASSQGLLNCIIYGWTQHMFRRLKRRGCRDMDTQTPLLRSQKRFYGTTPRVDSPSGVQSASAAL